MVFAERLGRLDEVEAKQRNQVRRNDAPETPMKKSPKKLRQRPAHRALLPAEERVMNAEAGDDEKEWDAQDPDFMQA